LFYIACQHPICCFHALPHDFFLVEPTACNNKSLKKYHFNYNAIYKNFPKLTENDKKSKK